MFKKAVNSQNSMVPRREITRRNFVGLTGAAIAAGASVGAAQSAAGKSAEENERKHRRKPTFVFVHGSWHGSWCFELVINELARKGFPSIARDRFGNGILARFPSSYLTGNLNPNERSPLADVTLDDYVKVVSDVILDAYEQGSGPVILLGHSSGGVILNEVGEKLGREVIKRLVYLAGNMTPHGMTPGEIYVLNGQDGAITPTLYLGSFAISGAFRVNPNSTDPSYRSRVKDAFYNDVAEEHIPAFLNLLTPDDPAGIYGNLTTITKERWGRIPRTYIRTLLDHSTVIQIQDFVIQEADKFTPDNKTDVVTLHSSHSPFFSMPERLADVLAELAEEER